MTFAQVAALAAFLLIAILLVWWGAKNVGLAGTQYWSSSCFPSGQDWVLLVLPGRSFNMNPARGIESCFLVLLAVVLSVLHVLGYLMPEMILNNPPSLEWGLLVIFLASIFRWGGFSPQGTLAKWAQRIVLTLVVAETLVYAALSVSMIVGFTAPHFRFMDISSLQALKFQLIRFGKLLALSVFALILSPAITHAFQKRIARDG